MLPDEIFLLKNEIESLTATTGYKYLLATPERLHAEELCDMVVKLLDAARNDLYRPHLAVMVEAKNLIEKLDEDR